jgi:4-amino-4-deoxy-L-arabinose transferase-like glycosyltransferase
MGQAPVTGAPWLTVETLLWAGVIIVAAAVRLLDLERFSLNPAEANLSLAALNWFKGSQQAGTDVSPFVAGTSGLIFMIFGAGDATARILSAVAGVVPVILTYRLRDGLGRWQALVAALLFALSASFLHASRTSNGEIVAIAGIYAAMTSLWVYVRTRSARELYVASAAAAISLAAGQAAYTALLICGSFALITIALRAARALDLPEIDAALEVLKASPHATRNAAITFLVTFMAAATAGLTNPLGLQGAINIGETWLMQWTLPANQPAPYYVQLLGTYELLPLLFGLIGLFVYLGRGDRISLFLAWWAALSLTFYTLRPDKQPEAMLVILVPFVWTAARATGDMFETLRKDFSLANDGVFVMLGALTCGIFGINLSGFAQDGQSVHLIVVVIAVGMLVVLGLLAGGFAVIYRTSSPAAAGSAGGTVVAGFSADQWQVGFGRALSVIGIVGLLVLGAMFISQSMNLNFNHADDPHEPMVDSPSTMEARELRPMLEDLSNRWEGDPLAAPIAADATIGNVLRWYLRDFQNVRYFDSAQATASEPIVIVAAQGPQPGFANYESQKIRWRWLNSGQPLSGPLYLRWLLYRGIHDVPPSYDIIVYVQMR